MKQNTVQNIKVIYESEYSIEFRIKVIPHQKGIKPKYYNWGYYKNDDTSRVKYRDKLAKLRTLDYSKKPKCLQRGIDYKGREMWIAKLGYNSNYCGQYAVRYLTKSRYSMKWQVLGIYKRLSDAKHAFLQRSV